MIHHRTGDPEVRLPWDLHLAYTTTTATTAAAVTPLVCLLVVVVSRLNSLLRRRGCVDAALVLMRQVDRNKWRL